MSLFSMQIFGRAFSTFVLVNSGIL